MTFTIDVEITGRAIPRFSRREAAAFVRKVLRTARNREITDVSIAFVDDATMKRLNQKFRQKNTTTDVLTFPADEGSAEIVISIAQARRQAKTERHSLATEVRYLLVHGVLHALGYDHETDRGEMNELELKVRETVGLK